MNLMLLASTFHPTIGGAETYAVNLAMGIGAEGHRVLVATDAVSGRRLTENFAPGVTVRRLQQYREGFSAQDRILWEEMQICLYPELAGIAEEFQPDILISNSLDLCVIAKCLSLHLVRPWVATFHEQVPEQSPMGEARLRVAYGLLRPDAVIAGSRFYLDRAVRYGDAHRSHLIYHGIDTDRFRDQRSGEEVRKRYAIHPGDALVISVGRLKPRKGFVDLLRAIQVLRQKGRRVAVVIAGSVNSASIAYRDELHSIVPEMGLEGWVHFDETLLHDHMPFLLSAADIVVQASHEEGLGLAVIEAMACSRPVITTRISGVNEITTRDDVALVVDANAPAQLAEAIEVLLDDPSLRRQLGERARGHVETNFSHRRMVTDTLALLQLIRGSWHG